MTTKLRAKFDGRALVPLEPVDLPTDQILDIEVQGSGSTNDEPVRPGSAQAILRAVAEPPHLTREDVAELERVIEASRLPVKHDDIFDDRAE